VSAGREGQKVEVAGQRDRKYWIYATPAHNARRFPFRVGSRIVNDANDRLRARNRTSNEFTRECNGINA